MICFAMVLTLSIFKHESLLYLISFSLVLGNILFPTWFFQGIERMRYITILNILPRFFGTLLIFIFITKSDDYLLLAGINSATVILTGIMSLVVIRYKFNIKINYPGGREIKYHLNEGWHLFISSIAVNLYTTSTTFILGLFTNNTIVGYFTAADKIRLAFQAIFFTISQTTYPHISEMVKTSTVEALKFIRRAFFIFSTLGLALSMLLYLFAKPIVFLLLGANYLASILVLQILSWSIFFISISNVIGIQMMTNMGLKAAFSKILIISAIINLFISFLIVPVYLEIGSSIAILITEILVSGSLFIYVLKNRTTLLAYNYV